jgi:ketosteroid isomerase-like protein
MKSLLVGFLMLLSANALFAQAKISKPVQALVQIEREWSDADVKKDVAALNRIMADDWTGIDFQGAVLTKAEALGEVARQTDATETSTTTLGKMKVRIFGNTAVVSGTEIETSKYRGNDSSGTYIWTDVFVERKGRWQAVSSQSTKLVAEKGDEVLARFSARGVAMHHRLMLAAR